MGLLMANALLQKKTNPATTTTTSAAVVEVVQNYQQFGEHSFSFSLVA